MQWRIVWARVLWIRLYTNAPARKFKRSAVKNIVRFPPVKANGGKSILVESILKSKYSSISNLTRDRRIFSTASNIYGFRRSWTTYLHAGFWSAIPIWWPKICRGETIWAIQEWALPRTFHRFRRIARKHWYKFLLVDETAIYQPLISNCEKLYQYKERPTLGVRNLPRCAELISLAMSLSRLIAKLGDKASLRGIYS